MLLRCAFSLCFSLAFVVSTSHLSAAVYRASGSVTESFAGFGSTLDSFDSSGSG